MKPRIKYLKNVGMWKCRGNLLSGWGKTPKSAYNDWMINSIFRDSYRILR